jgi:hypothetical protein
MKISKDFEEFFELLNLRDVKYLMIGGYALAVHAEPRYTKDVDIFYHRSHKNSERLMKVLVDFGFESLEISAQELSEEGKIFQLGNPPLRIDLLNEISGITFDEAWENRITTEYGDQTITVIGKKDLIQNKKESDREQDRLDVKRLEEEG